MVDIAPVTAQHDTTYGVVLTPGLAGLHSGIFYRLGREPGRILHLAWHLKLQVDDAGSGAWWVVAPTLSRAQKAAVVARAGLVARRHADGALPYGFDLDGVTIDADGAVDLGGRVGLTCATFVQVLHAAAGASLLATDSWDQRQPARRAEDTRAQTRLVAALEPHHPRQAARVRAQVGATRIRAEEVAAASGLTHRPAEYQAVDLVAPALAAEVHTRAPSHPHKMAAQTMP
jgi:hypothetical protein